MNIDQLFCFDFAEILRLKQKRESLISFFDCFDDFDSGFDDEDTHCDDEAEIWMFFVVAMQSWLS